MFFAALYAPPVLETHLAYGSSALFAGNSVFGVLALALLQGGGVHVFGIHLQTFRWTTGRKA